MWGDVDSPPPLIIKGISGFTLSQDEEQGDHYGHREGGRPGTRRAEAGRTGFESWSVCWAGSRARVLALRPQRA